MARSAVEIWNAGGYILSLGILVFAGVSSLMENPGCSFFQLLTLFLALLTTDLALHQTNPLPIALVSTAHKVLNLSSRVHLALA